MDFKLKFMDFRPRQQVLCMEVLQNGLMIDIMIVKDLILTKKSIKSKLKNEIGACQCGLFKMDFRKSFVKVKIRIFSIIHITMTKYS